MLNDTLPAFVLLLATLAPAFPGDASPVGTWQSTSGESRYDVSLCGDGTELCARLTWLRDDARSAENLARLDTFVLRHAKPVADNEWRGVVTYAGRAAGGSLTLVGENTLTLHGCQFIACREVDFVRL